MITHLLLNKIQRADYNPRTMSEDDMDSLMESIRTFGFVEPVVVNRRLNAFVQKDILEPEFHYILVGGHQRCTAVERIIAAGVIPKGIQMLENGKGGKEPAVPVVLVDLNPQEEKALNLALNKISGEWDQEKLASVIAGLKDTPLIASTGFSTEEIAAILSPVHKAPIEGETHVCTRCSELKKQLEGHERHSGHMVKKEGE